jgi:hypothetical protein
MVGLAQHLPLLAELMRAAVAAILVITLSQALVDLVAAAMPMVGQVGLAEL